MKEDNILKESLGVLCGCVATNNLIRDKSWGSRIRTWPHGFRVRRPTARLIPIALHMILYQIEDDKKVARVL